MIGQIKWESVRKKERISPRFHSIKKGNKTNLALNRLSEVVGQPNNFISSFIQNLNFFPI